MNDLGRRLEALEKEGGEGSAATTLQCSQELRSLPPEQCFQAIRTAREAGGNFGAAAVEPSKYWKQKRNHEIGESVHQIAAAGAEGC